ncbi:MAG: helix-turn-helix domain-containing protein, partial [Candidatus Pacebacteria bacterium]|nr:helix-turn-helix domain-containing protein [Candidatus Paceibacterota bacterium]
AVGVTASTGIAATHMNGLTIHSWSGIGIKDSLTENDIEKLIKRKYIRERLVEAKVLIIDEVSMLHHFRLDMVDEMCRAVRKDKQPFGGLQVVLAGDFFQLPPISRGREIAHFVHQSNVWQEMDLKICYLEEQFRQDDDELLRVLFDIRKNDVSEETLEPLRKRYMKDVEGDIYPTKLYTHNADVDKINEQELEKLGGEETSYDMEGIGKDVLVDILKKSCLAPEILRLKDSAVVMFVKNNFEEGYVNGTLGIVERIDVEGLPVVRLKDGKTIHVKKETWLIDEDGEKLAEIYQLPLRLAWAITVHKSQGMSLDAAEIDLSKSFTPGMGYVALSRVRTLSGLKLMGFNDTAKRVSDEVLVYDKVLQESSEKAVEEIEKMSEKEIEKKQEIFVESVAGSVEKKKEKKLSTHEKTKLLVDKKYTVEAIALERQMTVSTILSHLEKIKKDGWDVDMSYLKPAKTCIKEIEAAFKKTKDIKLSPVKKIVGNKYSFNELRLARIFLDL